MKFLLSLSIIALLVFPVTAIAEKKASKPDYWDCPCWSPENGMEDIYSLVTSDWESWEWFWDRKTDGIRVHTNIRAYEGFELGDRCVDVWVWSGVLGVGSCLVYTDTYVTGEEFCHYPWDTEVMEELEEPWDMTFEMNACLKGIRELRDRFEELMDSPE